MPKRGMAREIEADLRVSREVNRRIRDEIIIMKETIAIERGNKRATTNSHPRNTTAIEQTIILRELEIKIATETAGARMRVATTTRRMRVATTATTGRRSSESRGRMSRRRLRRIDASQHVRIRTRVRGDTIDTATTLTVMRIVRIAIPTTITTTARETIEMDIVSLPRLTEAIGRRMVTGGGVCKIAATVTEAGREKGKEKEKERRKGKEKRREKGNARRNVREFAIAPSTATRNTIRPPIEPAAVIDMRTVKMMRTRRDN
jgi:hypothetical protein